MIFVGFYRIGQVGHWLSPSMSELVLDLNRHERNIRCFDEGSATLLNVEVICLLHR